MIKEALFISFYFFGQEKHRLLESFGCFWPCFKSLSLRSWTLRTGDRDANLTLNTRRLKSLVQDTIPAMNSACHCPLTSINPTSHNLDREQNHLVTHRKSSALGALVKLKTVHFSGKGSMKTKQSFSLLRGCNQAGGRTRTEL